MPGWGCPQAQVGPEPDPGVSPTSTLSAHGPPDQGCPRAGDSETDAAGFVPIHSHAAPQPLKHAPPPHSPAPLATPGARLLRQTLPVRFYPRETPKSLPAFCLRVSWRQAPGRPARGRRTPHERVQTGTSTPWNSEPFKAAQRFPHPGSKTGSMTFPQRSGTISGRASEYPALVRRSSPTATSLSRSRSF